MSNVVKLPFGTGEAIITGTFIPEEKEYFNHKEGWGQPGEPASFEIESFVVGGVDIIEELYDMFIPVSGLRGIHTSFLDEFVADNWDLIYKQCVEEE